MQTCTSCQFESPLGAKFCRQCGAPLIAESEFTGASTRNYGRQQPAFAPAVSAPLPPSIGDVVSADTSRYYQAPTPAQQAFLTPSISTAPLPKKLKAWRYFSFLLVLVVGMGLGAILTTINFDEPPTADPAAEARHEAQAAKADLDTALAEQFRAAQEDLRQRQEQLRQLAEEAASAGVPASLGEVQLLDLKTFEYPGAATANYSNLPGSEMVQMRSKDSFENILQHYQKKFGKPLMLIIDEDDKSAAFQSATKPAVYVSIGKDDDHDGFWQILITRAPFHFPQLALPAPPAALAPPAPVKP